MLFFCGCDISQNFLTAKNPGKDTADTCIVITDFFIGKGKVSLNRKLFSMFSRTSPLWPVRAGARSYITESALALPIISRFGYSLTIQTSFCFVYQLSQRIMTCSLLWNSGMTLRIQVGRKGKRSYPDSTQTHKTWCLQNSVHSDSWNCYVRHG